MANPRINLVNVIKDLFLTAKLLQPTEPKGLKATFHESSHPGQVVLLYGDNAAGKSLLTRIIASQFKAALPKKSEFECLEVSMRTRTSSGFGKMFILYAVRPRPSGRGLTA